MDAPFVFVVVSVLVLLALVAILVLRRGSFGQRLSPLASLALAFVISGIVFGDNRVLGYGLFAVAVAISVVDIVLRRRGAAPRA